jgi:hypothetical protein
VGDAVGRVHERDGDGREIDDRVSDEVREFVREHPWIVPVARIGWVAKGVVYSLFGIVAIAIARGEPSASDDEASPKGALGTIRDASGGRALLAVLCVGLVMYVAWRILSVAILRGSDAKTWLERIGYSLSALFYVSLAWVAGRAALRNSDPGQDNQVESVSRRVLEWTAGRWLLGIAGVVVIVVGAYFVIDKGIRRRFRKDLDMSGASEGERRLLDVTGVVGWIGRGIVTALVGLFVLRAAWRFDPEEANGFDQALREVADTTTGSWLVLASAVGLVVYGVFCIVSARRQALRS